MSSDDMGNHDQAEQDSTRPLNANSTDVVHESASSSGLQAGDIVGENYEITGLLDSGGMGQIYRVQHSILKKNYAMKILNSQQVSEKAWRRLQVEAQAIARINHPNIVGIYNFGLHQGRTPYYVMDLLEGQNLASLIRKSGALELGETIAIFLEICQGLGFAHRKGIIHRDIKPSNLIILNQRGDDGAKVKIVDFGIAKLSQTADPNNQNLTNVGEVFGTPYYMSPEQSIGERIDERSDIYSLGCTLFECLTGRPPFRGETSMATVIHHQETSPPTLQAASGGKIFPDALERVVATMLAKEPMHRYQDLNKVAQDLSSIGKSGQHNVQIADKKSYEEQENYNDHVQNTSSQHYTLEKQTGKILKVAAVTTLVLLAVTMVALNIPFKNLFDGSRIQPSSVVSQNSRENSFISENGGAQNPNSDRRLAKFSRVSSDGESIQFDFPTEKSIGTIGVNSKKIEEARGTKVFAINDKLFFRASEWAVANPEILNGFRSSDLYSLSLPTVTEGADVRKAMPCIAGLSELRILNLELSNVADDQIKYLDHLTKLENLNVNDTNITGGGISKLKSLRNLTHLYFNASNDVSPMLEAIAGSDKLAHLTIEDTEKKISDDDIKNIARCRNLEYLDIMNTGATDQMLEHLTGMPKLRKLDIKGCPISKLAIVKFRNSYKGKKISLY